VKIITRDGHIVKIIGPTYAGYEDRPVVQAKEVEGGGTGTGTRLVGRQGAIAPARAEGAPGGAGVEPVAGEQSVQATVTGHVPGTGGGLLPVVPLAPIILPILDEIDASFATNPELSGIASAGSSGSTQLYGGGALAAAGGIGGIALGVAGGSLSTGVKVLAGLASVAAGVGGGLLAYNGYKKKKEAERYVGIIKGSSKPTPDEMAKIATFDAPMTHPFYVVKERINQNLSVEVHTVPKVSKNSNTPPPAQGISLAYEPMNPEGHPAMVEIAYVESKTITLDVCGPFGLCSTGSRPESGKDNRTILYDTSGDEICQFFHHRWMGQHEPGHTGLGHSDIWGWMRGVFGKAYRKCGACDSKQFGDGPWLQWNTRKYDFENWQGTGMPPQGFYMHAATSTFLGEVQSGLANQNMPSTEVGGGLLDTQPEEIRGPMAAIMQLYRSMRAASPDVQAIVFPSVDTIFNVVVDAAKEVDHTVWWKKVQDWMGVVMGLASFVCEVAAPILGAINPLVGAALGTGMRIANGITGIVQDPSLRGGLRMIGALAESPLGELGTTELQGLLDEGWSRVSDPVSAIGEMVDGWFNMKSLFVGDLPALAESAGLRLTDALAPLQQYEYMLSNIYQHSSNQILQVINQAPAMPFSIDRLKAYTILPDKFKGTAQVPLYDPREMYALI
jgi:hypothetical protein